MRVIADVTLVPSNFYSLFLCTSTRHLKFGQEDCVGTQTCHNISIKSEGLALQDVTLVGGIRLNYLGRVGNKIVTKEVPSAPLGLIS